MKFIISALCCLAVVVADKLNNVYLPPKSSITAGGNGNLLQAPLPSGRQIFSGIYQPFQQRNIYSNQQKFSQLGNIYSNQQLLSQQRNIYSKQPLLSQQRNIYSNQQLLSQQGNIYSNQQQSFLRNYPAGSTQQQIPILRLNNDNNGDGTYRFEYETANQIAQQESGQLKNAGTDQQSSVVQGSYSYVGPDGQTYTIDYVADELGFRATGNHLPVAPPIPAEIQKSLELNAAAEARGIVDNGQYRSDSSVRVNSAQINRQYLAPKAPQNKGGYRY